jgi:hypothetical protein
MLYILCVWVLLRRKRNGYMWQLVSSTILFSLETINLALEAANIMYHYFGYVGTAENGPDSPYQILLFDRILSTIVMAKDMAGLLCLCV